MSRSLWFVAGAGAGVYAIIRVRRAAESLTADGLRDRLRGVGVGARLFREEVRAGQEEREAELRERFGLVPDDHSRTQTRVPPPAPRTPAQSRRPEEGTD